MSTAPHIQRMEVELSELDDKLTRLKEFFKTEVFALLDTYEQALMREQAAAMDDYLDVLTTRLDYANEKADG